MDGRKGTVTEGHGQREDSGLPIETSCWLLYQNEMRRRAGFGPLPHRLNGRKGKFLMSYKFLSFQLEIQIGLTYLNLFEKFIF